MEHRDVSQGLLRSAARRAARPLWIADTLAAGVAPRMIAQQLGKPERWVRRHADLLAPGVRTLFTSGRFTSLAAYVSFRQLPPGVRRLLLDTGGRLTVARLRRAQTEGAVVSRTQGAGNFR